MRKDSWSGNAAHRRVGGKDGFEDVISMEAAVRHIPSMTGGCEDVGWVLRWILQGLHRMISQTEPTSEYDNPLILTYCK